MPIITLPGGELRDEIRQPAYDTITLAAADGLAGVRRFFQSNVDVNGNPKSLAQSNMEQPGSFPTATSYLMQGLCIDSDNQSLTAATATNLNILPVLARKSSVSLQIGVKNYWQSPLRLACGRMSNEFATAVGAVPLFAGYQQYGWAAIQPIVFQGKHVVEINPLQNFSIAWQCLASDLTTAEAALTVAANTDLVFLASLKGLLRRPVQ